MKSTRDIHLRSLARKLKCVKEDFSDVDVLSRDFDKDFQKAWRMALDNIKSEQNENDFQELLDEIANNSSDGKKVSSHLGEQKDVNPSKESEHSKSEKMLFRKITLKTHPDRAGILGIGDEEKESRQAMLVRAHEAYR